MVETSSGISYYDLDRLCSEAVERNFRGESNTVNSVISQATYALAWASFTKWCQSQIDAHRAVHIASFGIIGYQVLRDNKKAVYIKLSDSFLQQHGIAYQPNMAEVESLSQVTLNPVCKPNFAVMAKSAQMDKQAFQTSLLSIFQLIGELLSESANVEIDLLEFGKFQAMNRQVMYAPFNKMKPAGLQGKQTVKALMDFGASGRSNQLPALQGRTDSYEQLQAQAYYASGSSKQATLNNMLFKQTGGSYNHANTYSGNNNDSPTRRYKKPFNDAKISSELLGAGDDPMARNQEFSLLASNPAALMKQSFKRPAKAVSRYPPVIDPFSRTLAAPISSQRHYFSVCHRIGTNFTPTGKGFYIDNETRTIKFKDINESGTKLDIVNDNDVEPADEIEEYEAVMYPQSADHKRIQARKVSFGRYRQYVENEISVDVIAPIRQYWLTHIIELIPGDLHAVEKNRIEQLIDSMLSEINNDYFDSVRKSILDYILKDDNEMRRLGIQQVLNQPIDWGDDFYHGIEPNEEWKHNVMMARMLMSENLCICSQATLELMRIWREKDYYQTWLVQIPQPEEKPVSLNEFINAQTGQIEKVKTLLHTDWSKSAVDILREELENLDKDQTKTFFESIAALMSNQVRELTRQSIQKYVQFFQRFQKDKGDYPTPQEIIKREYDPDSQFESTFLTLQLQMTTPDLKVDFSTPLQTVRDKLVDIVRSIIDKINQIPRADQQIANNDKTHLWDISEDDVLITDAEREIKDILDDNLRVVSRAAEVYDEFIPYLEEGKNLETFLENPELSKDACQKEIKKYEELIEKTRKKMPYEIRMNMFLVQCYELNGSLIAHFTSLIKKILNRVGDIVQQDRAVGIQTKIKTKSGQHKEAPEDSAKLVELEKDLEDFKNIERLNIKKSYEELLDWLMMIYEYPIYEVSDEFSKAILHAHNQVNSIPTMIETQENFLKEERTKIENSLMTDVKQFQVELDSVMVSVEEFKNFQRRAGQPEYLKQIKDTKARLERLQNTLTTINKIEADLEFAPSEDSRIAKAEQQIKPHFEFWENVGAIQASLKSWQGEPLNSIDPDEIEKEHKRMLMSINRSNNYFEKEKITKPIAIAKDFKKQLEEFKPFIPVIRAICTEGLQERHFKEIKQKVGVDIDRDQTDFAQVKIFIQDEPANRAFLEEIADTATKEFSNEKTLATMKKDWEPIEFVTKEMRSTYILEGENIELIQQTLDDHMIKTQTMKGSPFAKVFIDEIIQWEKLLMKLQENLEMWLKVQVVWMYLEPVFSSEDIMKQMPLEGTKFREVDKSWKKLMDKVVNNPSAYTVMEIEELGQVLNESHAKLEEVQKGLNDYLEAKRGLFPRFYFLSNDELLEILSETKDPLKVQPHLKKCFEGIAELQFDEEKKIHSMISGEGENVPFTRIIDPVASKGNVEDWLKQVEDVMLKSVKEVIEKSLTDYMKKDRDKWVVSWQGQAVLAVSMMFWTQQAEDSMKKGGMQGLKAFKQRLDSQLNGIVGVVRTPINKLTRATLEALVVLDVHARDVIQGDLIDKEISSPTEFAWISQLRYYWDNNELLVKIIISTLDYNYEYLGNTPRLVITPLTDRCYRTLCGAIYLNYGGAPEGPAGTGKTETVKDLAKALARHCIVFNCSDGLDYLQMGKFFMGLASCGAWSCFDEFNRIQLEVLSVIAQQLQQIQHAVDQKLEEFLFQGVKIPLKLTCNCFITMNPGYAGRAELPDNLKALFRTVAMMVPDYALIAQISLYSFGFEAAPDLAVKIVTTYKLCSEQLSSQDHYDYGMRAVKSVLTAAGNLKRKYITEDESILMLRAINDVNLAKFLSHDLPLFKNITSDLFPGVVLPEPDYADLFSCIENQLKISNLQNVDYFREKIIQLYEMVVVRHGLMVVGLPFAGKTSAIKILAAALSECKEKGLMEEMKTHIKILNPKSITMGQLYGSFDEVSHDWYDGVLAVWYRTMASGMDVKDRRWLIFDGPVDAIWIENMNTVLDDNKKLCLMSGEIIQMSANMNMIFEPMDLAVASPATVSRCGMVYMQPHEMGWQPLVDSWKNTIPECIRDQFKIIDEIIEVVIQPCIDFIRSSCKEITPTIDQNLVQGLLRIWKTFLDYFGEEGFLQKLEQKDKKAVVQFIDHSFVFSAAWSLCISIEGPYRRPFDKYFKEVCNGEIENLKKFNNRKILPPILDRGTIYDYVYKPETQEWAGWMKLVSEDDLGNFPASKQPQEIIVTTTDTIRYSYIQEWFINNSIPFLFCGPTGTGKSVYIQNVLLNTLSKDKFITIEIGFSAQTRAIQVQNIVDEKLQKIRRDTFGPAFGMKQIIFIDDLNMPKVEEYGAQPPIEILRQFLDQGGWYDLTGTHPFKNIIDTMLCCAMGPPGGGKSFITPRFQRHMNVVSFANADETIMNTIFRTILKWFFKTRDFNSEVQGMEKKIVEATMKVYYKIQEDLKPTPLKSHYTFNLRDFSKVICGICLIGKQEMQTSEVAIRLWAHEASRVFGDRLINDTDKLWMLNIIKECVRAPFGASFDTIFAHLDTNKDGKVETLDEFRGLAFGDVLTPFGTLDRPYEEIQDNERLQECCEDALNQYNAMSDKPMELVLFAFAIEHLLRVSRILKTPGGHAMLVGVGGSGRQSLTKLASKISDFDIFQIEIKKNYRMIEWREDMKSMMRQVGGKGNSTSFILSDVQIKEEGFLEDVNNILNTGEIPNMFPPEEKAEVMELVRKPAKEENRCPEGTPQQLFSYFVERCKKFLHIVLCFSPIGDTFRNRVRNFPSLVNCTTIDWFSEWPPDALQSVAVKFLGEVEMEESVRESCVQMVQQFHTSTNRGADKFLREQKRHYYVTPTSYLELITTFKTLLAQKRDEIMGLKNRYENGYNCLIRTEQDVGKMQVELEAMQPELIASSEEVEKQTIIVEKQTVDAEVIKEAVAKEKASAQVTADAANAIKTECEAALAEAMPVVEEAKKALGAIGKNDVTFIKQMRNPSADIKMVLSAVCILFGLAPKREINPETQKRENNFWPTTMTMISDGAFLSKLLNYDYENIPTEIIEKLVPVITQERFKPVELKTNVSATVGNLALWCVAMEKYYRVDLDVRPKKAQLAVAQEKFNEVDAQLKIKEADLKIVEDKVNGLRADLKFQQDKKADLEAKVADCKAKLERATQLINGLGGEKARWKAASESLTSTYNNLSGDVLISSGMIAYLGAFNSILRDELAAEWVANCDERQIPNSGKFSLERVLGEPVEIRNWTICGLPSDGFSIENGIITNKTRRWPLFIDPQGQANKWIRMMGKDEKIKVLKFTEKSYLKILESCIRMGTPCLIENVGEDLDPAIEPLLQKQLVKRGNSYSIKIGDGIIEYAINFKFYLTTKLRNPHYLPEVSTKVTLINFMITYEGLSDQLLGILVAKEQPELETQKEQLVLDSAKNKKKLLETENQILATLQNSKDILGDASAIQILQSASQLSVELGKKQEIAEKTEKDIDEARMGYKPVALITAGLFFCISDLANIDPMYQYSLGFFVLLFTTAIAEAEKAEELPDRLAALNKEFLESLYRNICRSLFEKDKMIFSFMLALKLKELAGALDQKELSFLLTGGISLGEKLPEIPESASWVTEKILGEVFRLNNIPSMKGYLDYFIKNIDGVFKEMFDSNAPQDIKLTEGWDMKLTDFQKLLVLRTVRPDKLIPAMTNYVVTNLGAEFMSPPTFELMSIVKESANSQPLIFVLSPGSDPMNSLQAAATLKKKELAKVSLGQGQGPRAEAEIKDAQKKGNWVVLQNCHLAVFWMGTLERICEENQVPKNSHRDFRLWLTSYPSKDFPVSILQNGVKMTNEAPKGLRSNLGTSYNIDPINNKQFFDGCSQSKKFKKLCFGLCFFHAVIQERRLFGPLGWNIRYEFNESDLRISVRQLRIFLEEYPDKTPFDALKYLTGECNYGGRVTEAKDRRLILCLLDDYYTERIFDDDYKFSPSGIYYAPPHGEYESYIEYAKSLPTYAEPEVYGLHSNAAITKDINETNSNLDAILSCQNSSGGGGSGDTDAMINALADSILKDVPDVYDVESAEKAYPVRYEQSFNTVLTQELTRFNNLIRVIRSSLKNLKLAIKGEVLLSSQLEEALNTLISAKVPKMWLKKSYPSLKPLAGYIKDLKERLNFFQTWIEEGIPAVFWINKFYFTQGFLTGALQNYARDQKIPIDKLGMDFEVVFDEENAQPPQHGVNVLGMFFEGCKWDYNTRALGESDPKVLFVQVPMIWFKPCLVSEYKTFMNYNCPLYKTSERRGVLMTTGHSTNFVIDIRLPSDQHESHWIKRGVAMLCSLDE